MVVTSCGALGLSAGPPSSFGIHQVLGLSSWMPGWAPAAIPLPDGLPWSEWLSLLLSARELAECFSQIELEPLQNDSPS